MYLCFQALNIQLGSFSQKRSLYFLLLCGNPTFLPSPKHGRGKLCNMSKCSLLFTNNFNDKYTHNLLCIRHCQKTVHSSPQQLCAPFYLQRPGLSEAEGWSLNLGKGANGQVLSSHALCPHEELFTVSSWNDTLIPQKERRVSFSLQLRNQKFRFNGYIKIMPLVKSRVQSKCSFTI